MGIAGTEVAKEAADMVKMSMSMVCHTLRERAIHKLRNTILEDFLLPPFVTSIFMLFPKMP
jgi:hypothetical protein